MEQSTNQPQEAVVVDLLGQERHQERMIDVVVGTLDVTLNEPGGPVPSPVDRVEGGVTPPTRSEAVGVVAELRLVIRFQQGAYDFLQQFVGPGWQAQWALLARAFLLDVDAPHGGPAIPLVPQRLDNRLDFRQAHAVDRLLRRARG